MPNFSIMQQLGAGAIVQNLFAGSAFEFVARPSRVAIAMLGENTTTPGDLVTTIQFGPEVQLEQGTIAAEAAAGLGCKLPDDIIVDDVAAAGDRLVARVQNTSAGALWVHAKVRIIPLA